ncbi:MAG: aldehyde ferredoxin oxidoreductase family protein, partial [Candidatus Bathyarchaeia archaeon]
MFGYTGKILRVDLSSERVSTEPLGEETAERYLGGKCLGAAILYRELRPGIDPLGPDNRLILLAGPLQGTTVPGSGRFAVVSKSPETHGYGESHAGGTFGPLMKMAGYDAIIVEGRSEGPVYLDVVDDGVEIRGAGRLWGKDVYETEKGIREGRKGRTSIVSIGPAGERLVRIACVINDLNRAAGRGGMGAVMGSKRLKAVAVTGTGGVDLYDERGLREHAKDIVARITKLPSMIDRQKYGTSAFASTLNAQGILPTKNFQRGYFAGANKIDGHTMANTILVGRRACYACPIACIRCVEVREGPFAPVHPEMGGPEYETVASLGSLLLIDDLTAIAKANELCNLYGIDTIAVGVVLAYAMECYAREIFNREELDGVDLSWGNAEAMVRMVEKIGERDGVGDLLAEGVKRVAERIGKGSEDF